MTFLPYVAASYGLGVVVPAGFALAAWRRMRAATRRLAAIDPRRARRQAAAQTGDRPTGDRPTGDLA
jgi:HAMP domain-containing protein